MEHRYVRMLPLQSRGGVNEGYLPSSQIDFMINLEEGREIAFNSMQLGFKLNITTDTNTPISATDKIFLNQYAGFHSVFESVQTLVDAGQGEREVEMILSYPRMVANLNYVNNTDINLSSDLLKSSSGLCANSILGQRELLGDYIPSSIVALGNNKNGEISCDLKLNFCLNKSYDAQMQPCSISGRKQIRIILRTNPANHVLYGDDMTNNVSYTLNDLILQWVEQPKTHNNNEALLQTVQQIKLPIPTSTASLTVRTPSALTNKWMMSFSSNNDEISNTADYYRMSVLPAIKRIEMYVNDAYSSVQYPLNQGYVAAPEVMQTSLMSLGANPENASNYWRYLYDVSGTTTGTGSGLILGANSPYFYPAETRITVNIVSGINSTISTWFAYAYLFSLTKV